MFPLGEIVDPFRMEPVQALGGQLRVKENLIAINEGKLEIAFEKAGNKKVMASFVEAV